MINIPKPNDFNKNNLKQWVNKVNKELSIK